MKTLPVIAFLAALAAFVFSPLSFEVAGSLLFGTGLLCMIAADYGRGAEAAVRTAPVIDLPPAVPHRPVQHFELAA